MECVFTLMLIGGVAYLAFEAGRATGRREVFGAAENSPACASLPSRWRGAGGAWKGQSEYNWPPFIYQEVGKSC